jgi:hypothetical protein
MLRWPFTYFFLLKEKSNKKVQGETRTLRAFSPGQRLLLLRYASFVFWMVA